MYKKNRNSLIHKRLTIEAKSKVVIQWVRTGCWHCRLFVSLFKPSKCSIAFAALQYFLLSILLAKGGQDGVQYSGTGHCYACSVLQFRKVT